LLVAILATSLQSTIDFRNRLRKLRMSHILCQELSTRGLIDPFEWVWFVCDRGYRMNIIDTHLHLIDTDRLRYPWLEQVGALRRSFTIDEYLNQAPSLGISQMLHMECDVAEADIDTETGLASDTGHGVGGVISACRPENADFRASIERTAANRRVKGYRRVLHTGAHEMALTPRFIENVRLLSAYDRTFDLCVWSRHLPIAAKLARSCSEVQFVLDHCGMPDIKGREMEPWRSHLREIATLPNVACKVSGVIAYGDSISWTVADLRPYVEYAIECFGWDRVVWGSDWPVCTLTADLRRWVSATHEILDGTSIGERAKLFEHNAMRIYSLEPAGK